MPIPPSALALLTLLAGAPATAMPGPQTPNTEGRQLLLSAMTGQVQEVRIGPDVPTNLLFDGLVRLEGVEEREHFRRVSVAEDSLMVMPSRELLGKRLRMPVRFMDGTDPAVVEFILVVVASAQAERQVEVYRPRPLELCQREAREEREKARQFEAALEQARAEPKVPGGLTGLLASKQMDQQGVVARQLQLTQRLEEALRWKRARSYRTNRPREDGEGKPEVVRVAVELWVINQDARPWTVTSAELVAENGTRRSVSVWQQGPIIPGEKWQRVVVEAELPEAEARGSFTLVLWEDGGTRPVTFGGVSFP